MGEQAKKLEQDAGFFEEEDDGLEDTPIFTPELAALKAKAAGKEYNAVADDDDDVDMEAEDEDAVKADHAQYPDAFSDSEDEKDDFTIRKSDALIVAATADNDHSNLEIYVYEHEKANMYVHHEIILSSYPLCLEWLPRWQE